MAVLNVDDDIMRKLQARALKDGLTLEEELHRLLDSESEPIQKVAHASKPEFGDFLLNYPRFLLDEDLDVFERDQGHGRNIDFEGI